jgi:hypothetical protein
MLHSLQIYHIILQVVDPQWVCFGHHWAERIVFQNSERIFIFHFQYKQYSIYLLESWKLGYVKIIKICPVTLRAKLQRTKRARAEGKVDRNITDIVLARFMLNSHAWNAPGLASLEY